MADESRSKEKLKELVRLEITNLFGSILDYTEIACADKKEAHKALRSKILRLSNDCIRNIQKELDSKYSVSYNAPSMDVIVIGKK